MRQRLSASSLSPATAITFALVTAVAAANGLDSKLFDVRTGLPQSQDLRQVAITGDRLGGFVLPSAPLASDLRMSCTRSVVWQVDDTQRLELRGDVRITFGAFAFSSDAATIWINRLPTADGEVTQLAMYFLKVDDPSGRAGFGAAGRNLLVTASMRGEVFLRSVTRTSGPAAPSELSARGQGRLAAYLRTLAQSVDDGTARLSPLPGVDRPASPPDPPPEPGAPPIPPAPPAGPGGPTTIGVPLARGSELPIVQPKGVINFAAKEITVDESTNSVTVAGSVMIDVESEGPVGPQRLELRAERGVLFLVPDALANLRRGRQTLGTEEVLGIYLEGGVVGTDGQYMVRGSKVYYDLKGGRATIVDAVLRTYVRLGGLVTLYARAAEMRQVSASVFEADGATVSTSEFFVPHLSVGAQRVTLTQPPPGVEAPAVIAAQDLVFRAGTVPVFALPGYEGNVEPQPLKSLEGGARSDLGIELMTRWDLYQLLGMAPPSGVDADLTVGGYTERGPALGTKFSLNKATQSGFIDVFGLYDFGGTDRTTSGLDVDKDAELRGMVEGRHQVAFTPELFLQTQLAYISDETFVTTFRRTEFTNRGEFESSLYLNNQSENTSLSLLLKYGLNDFLSNAYLLASRGYQVDKLPELTYRRFGDDIWDGLLWTQSWQANLMDLRPTDGSPASLGIPAQAFGLTSPNADISDAYAGAGYTDNFASRLHTRHELTLPFVGENWNVAPFLHGEVDAYLLEDFNAYSVDADSARYVLGGGVRASTRFVRVDDRASSRLFDIHRIRHIIEPNATLWYGYDSLTPGAIPIYDQSVEGMLGGSAAQLGVRQQWQTQRGGSGAWQSVTFLTIDAGVVLNDGADDFQPSDLTNPLQWAQSAIPAFYTWRPELSQFGSHAYGMGAWQISDTLTVAGTGTYLFDDRDLVTDPDAILENLAKGSVGLEMRHTPDVSTYLEYRYIAPTVSELLQFGVLYQVGKKYLIAFSPQYDLREGDLRRIQGSLARTFPDFTLNMTAGYDLIEDQTSLSLSLRLPAERSPVTWSGFSSDYRGP